MNRPFAVADYEVAIQHELARLRQAVADAGLTPRSAAYIRWIDERPGLMNGYWAICQPIREEYHDVEVGEFGSLDIRAAAKTLGKAFERAHLRVTATAREYRAQVQKGAA